MKRLIVMCGIPGSGKSTIAEGLTEISAEPVSIVSRDQIRFSIISANDEYFAKEKEVFKEFVAEIKDKLEKNSIVIADATHISLGSRTKLLNALGSSLKGCEVDAVVIDMSLDLALERNALRTGRKRVPDASIEQMYKNFTIPTEEEGFDRIIVVKGE